MTTNVLVALKNVLDLKSNELLTLYNTSSNNRANSMGDALEYYVKDLFCNSYKIQDFDNKDLIYSDYLSYLGNSNNPPDFIIKNSSAVEVKKIENQSFGDIALNSSHPKDYLYSNSTLINKACRECEDGWTEKEMVYVIGNIANKKLKVLWLLYGDCYCAEHEVYSRMKTTIQSGVSQIEGVEFAQTKELGKVNKVDPLGITNLRIRGMWSIKHPMKAFDYLVRDYKQDTELQVYCLMLKSKYELLPKQDKDNLNFYIEKKVLIKEDVKVKNPNNPAKFIDGILFKASLLG